jgi:hypothetical protein
MLFKVWLVGFGDEGSCDLEDLLAAVLFLVFNALEEVYLCFVSN